MLKVLLIEDNLVMLDLLETLLELEGFDVVTWKPFASVFTTLEQEKPDIILLDVNLNGINGFDILRHVRQDENLKSISVIMASGVDYREKSFKEGANGFLLKPYMPEDLINLIHDKVQI